MDAVWFNRRNGPGRNDLVIFGPLIKESSPTKKQAHSAGSSGRIKIGISIYTKCRHLYTDSIAAKLIERQNLAQFKKLRI
jgi:hypothetical protein